MDNKQIRESFAKGVGHSVKKVELIRGFVYVTTLSGTTYLAKPDGFGKVRPNKWRLEA